MLQCSIAIRGQPLARQAFEDFEPAFERAQFAVRQLGNAAFEGFIGDRRRGEMLPPFHRQAQCKAAAIVGIGLAIDEASANQSIDRAADRGRTPFDPRRDLIERPRLDIHHRGKQVALHADGLGRGSIAAELLDQPREPRGKRAR